MSEHRLNIFDGSHRLGQIIYNAKDEHFSFTYEDQWITSPTAYPLSPHFPLNEKQASSSTIRRFVENLLPEGRALDIASAHYNVTKNNVFALIRQLGQETAGALSFVADGQERLADTTSRREVSSEEMAARIARRDELPFALWDGKVRMSVAGFQDKLALYFEGSRMFLVEGEFSSTHILKPEPTDKRMSFLVANEHFCMTLARRIGLNVAPVDLLRLPTPVLVVERFDRVRRAQSVTRLHIIDACQALDFPVSYKYERNLGSGVDVRNIRDGVSFQQLFTLQEKCSSKARAVKVMTDWALMQFLLGNSDAHGKNFSFFCRREGLEPTPFYDLVSVVQYDSIMHEMAMAYGDEFELEKISPFALADFAHRCGLDRKFLSREMKRLAKLAMEQAPVLAESPVYQGGEKQLVGSIAELVEKQARRLIELAPQLLDVDPDLL